MKNVLFLSRTIPTIEPWDHILTEIDASIRVLPYSEDLDFESIDTVLAWNPPEGVFPKLPNLKLIQSLGMGVDHLFKCGDLPHNIPIARLVDEDMFYQMADYALYGTLKALRNIQRHNVDQRSARWGEYPRRFHKELTVGILGLGNLGLAVAERLIENHFSVISWSRSRKEHPNIISYYGDAQLTSFLNRSDILICLLPLTTATADLLNYQRLMQLPKGAYIINPARGEHIVDADLIRAIDEGHISGALLDVFRTEPLPKEHPFWRSPEIEITPHIAAETNPETANVQIVTNILRVRANKPPLNQVDPTREY